MADMHLELHALQGRNRTPAVCTYQVDDVVRFFFTGKVVVPAVQHMHMNIEATRPLRRQAAWQAGMGSLYFI
jgi:hypothetical protein